MRKVKEKIIYQYRAIDKYTKEIFNNGEMHFKLACEFNDPFESLSYFDFQNVGKGYQDWIYSIFKNSKNKLKRRKIIEQIALYNGNNEISQDKSEYLISCFSKRNDSILMWSHYANKHSGICIGFNTILEKNIDGYFLRIEKNNLNDRTYPAFLSLDEIPLFDVSYNMKIMYRNINLMKILLNKYYDWKYEHEIRAIIPKRYILNKNNNIIIKRSEIKSVIFGLKTDDEDVKELMDIIKKNNLNINLYKALYSNNKVGIKFEKIDYR